MKKAVVFGAGCIGRGFAGQLLCEAGCETAFVDLDEGVVDSMNKRGSYHLRTVFNEDVRDFELGPVKAFHAAKQAKEAVAALAEADIAATSVGAGALKYLVPSFIAALELRAAKNPPAAPLNVLLCENLHGAAEFFRGLLKAKLRPELHGWLDANVGLVETVIGRMVPVPTPEMRAADPSFILAEPYKELPVSKSGFRGEVPVVAGMAAYNSFEVFGARKLYLHNCGHALLAYLGFLRGHSSSCEALSDSFINKAVKGAMAESSAGIVARFKADPAWLKAHVEDLLKRFANKPLGDSVTRIGRDPLRKLKPDDRLVGAARLAEAAGVKPENLALGIAAALLFNAPGDASAAELQKKLEQDGFAATLKELSGIDAEEPLGKMVFEAYGRLREFARPVRRAVVAGHLCLDVIPAIGHALELSPGRLFEVGASSMSTGGAVSNTGLALRILGQPATLAARVGDDEFGGAIVKLLSKYGADVASGVKKAQGETSSYSIVLSIPGKDRIFLHCPGANRQFAADDVQDSCLEGASLLHFGYPPLMERIYSDKGAELETLLRKAKRAGLTTSMDMVMPDPDGPSGQADWLDIMKRVIPFVDIFLPSADEALYIFDREKFGQGDIIDAAQLRELTSVILDEGAAIAGIKLGARGLYLRTASESRLAEAGRARPSDIRNWAGRELWFPTYKALRFVGATGAGDATIAGFLSALMRGCAIEEAGRFANAVGACNVEAPDALSGLKSWEDTWRRLYADWPMNPLEIKGENWTREPLTGIWRGPSDAPALETPAA